MDFRPLASLGVTFRDSNPVQGQYKHPLGFQAGQFPLIWGLWYHIWDAGLGRPTRLGRDISLGIEYYGN